MLSTINMAMRTQVRYLDLRMHVFNFINAIIIPGEARLFQANYINYSNTTTADALALYISSSSRAMQLTMSYKICFFFIMNEQRSQCRYVIAMKLSSLYSLRPGFNFQFIKAAKSKQRE